MHSTKIDPPPAGWSTCFLLHNGDWSGDVTVQLWTGGNSSHMPDRSIVIPASVLLTVAGRASLEKFRSAVIELAEQFGAPGQLDQEIANLRADVAMFARQRDSAQASEASMKERWVETQRVAIKGFTFQDELKKAKAALTAAHARIGELDAELNRRRLHLGAEGVDA